MGGVVIHLYSKSQPAPSRPGSSAWAGRGHPAGGRPRAGAVLLPLLALAAAAGCAPGYRACSQGALVSVRSPSFLAAREGTNAPPSGARAWSVQVAPGAPVQVYAEQVIVMFSGGAAASNSVLSGLALPIVP
jgi:hypothetical protein